MVQHNLSNFMTDRFPISVLRMWSLIFLCIAAIAFVVAACGEKGATSPSPEGYNINKPVETKLPAMLDEISGIIYYPKDKSLFAIHDERGWLYKIFLDGKTKVEKWKYSPGADYEDVALADSTFFAIKSNGNIEAFRFPRPDSPLLKTIHSPLKGKNEFETLYLDSV